ncbi:PD-(D/E)XK nuclease family protein [Bradyrhizobium sp. DASA03005]|uniref:PD-(D/E)XK nuclease family protein n=1 Tax=Bradyrhizobium sp. SPXBL-02 TaxID=3395912 RepID=UPI003F6E8DE8
MPEDVVLPRLYERDIDVLLQEELIFSQAVRDIFSSPLGLDGPLQVTECSLSVVDGTGETDLLARFLVGGKSGVLLIENKIDAAFQPMQPERYRARANEMARGGQQAYCVLIAPSKYSEGNSAAAHFDGCVSYEDVAHAIGSQDTERAKHRAALLLRAVQQAKSSYIVIPAPEVTNMWQRIYEIARTEFPALQMKPPTDKGRNSWWVIFKGDLPARITIDWKVKNGVMDLSFWNGARHKPSPESQKPPEASFLISGTTTIFRVLVEKPSKDWVELTDQQIRRTLAVAQRLLNFHNTYANEFEPHHSAGRSTLDEAGKTC